MTGCPAGYSSRHSLYTRQYKLNNLLLMICRDYLRNPYCACTQYHEEPICKLSIGDEDGHCPQRVSRARRQRTACVCSEQLALGGSGPTVLNTDTSHAHGLVKALGKHSRSLRRYLPCACGQCHDEHVGKLCIGTKHDRGPNRASSALRERGQKSIKNAFICSEQLAVRVGHQSPQYRTSLCRRTPRAPNVTRTPSACGLCRGQG